MHQSLFFRLFPPPKYMAMRFAGLEISDDSIRCLQYSPTTRGRVVGKYDKEDMPEGLMVDGDVKNEEALIGLLKSFERKNDLEYVNISVPEEKAYLFETDVVGNNIKEMAQNIEFKLEENVPLSARDAIYYFDLMSLEATGGVLRASVSVVPKTYIEKQISMLQSSGLQPIAFEVVPKSIARAALTNEPNKTSLIVHIMNRKTGLYVVSGGVVAFTSTVAWGSLTKDDGATGQADAVASGVATLCKEINHTFSYWESKSETIINEIVLAGKDAPSYEPKLSSDVVAGNCPIRVANTWANAFDINSYIPPISKIESLDCVTVAGLALDL